LRDIDLLLAREVEQLMEGGGLQLHNINESWEEIVALWNNGTSTFESLRILHISLLRSAKVSSPKISKQNPM